MGLPPRLLSPDGDVPVALAKIRPALVARLPVLHVEAAALPDVRRSVDARALGAGVLIALRTAAVLHQHGDVKDDQSEDEAFG